MERIAPAIVRVLNEHDLLGTIAPETLATAIVAQLVSQSPRLKARERLLAEAGGAPECWICKLRIPMDAANDTAECFSIDHVVPRAQGGTHLGYENLRTAHRLCNAVRDMEHPSPKLRRSLDDMKHRLRARTPDLMEKNEIPTYEDGLEKDEKISLSHLRAGTYAHRKLDPNTGKMVEVKEQCERQVEQLRVNCGEPGS